LLPILNARVKKIMTYGRPVTTKGIRMINALPNRNLVFTACSNYCVSTGNVVGRWATVYNAIDFSQYDPNPAVNDDAPLMFLGRLDKIKGAHTAIKIAKANGSKLFVAGNVPHTPDNLAYYKTEIEPLMDGGQIIFLGPLNDSEKNKYLRQSKALLFPIEWDEPFGMVMIEAMACGTPVIAYKRGSVPEIVKDGINGFIAKDEQDIQQKLSMLHTIDRNTCRKIAEKRFDVRVIAQNYLSLFE
jgi:glycosyltransferase involved in cell wall biosynthesis